MPRRRGQIAARLLALIAAAFVLLPWGSAHRRDGRGGTGISAGPPVPADRPRPGRYRSLFRVTAVSLPGASPAASRALASMFAATGQMEEYCLTPEAAARGYRDVIARQLRGDCRYADYAKRDDAVMATMTCRVGAGMTTQWRMTGTAAPAATQLALVGEQTATGASGRGTHIEAEAITERIGDCP